MGNCTPKLFRKKKDIRILIVGLDAAGKTTIFNELTQNKTDSTVPTIGFNVETLKHKNQNYTFWDLGGQSKIRKLWPQHYTTVKDSNDQERIDEARDELSRMLSEDELRAAHLLVLGNKFDLPNAMNSAELTEKLKLTSLKNRNWFIRSTCATSGDGVYEALEWLYEQTEKSK